MQSAFQTQTTPPNNISVAESCSLSLFPTNLTCGNPPLPFCKCAVRSFSTAIPRSFRGLSSPFIHLAHTPNCIFFDRSGMCGKWAVLEQLLNEWNNSKTDANKVLIFSKSVKVLGFLQMLLQESASSITGLIIVRVMNKQFSSLRSPPASCRVRHGLYVLP